MQSLHVAVKVNVAHLLRVDQSLGPVFMVIQHRGPPQIHGFGHNQILLTIVWDTWIGR